jgi:SAM-dependent methyltransferase
MSRQNWDKIYAQNKQINTYPFSDVVSLVKNYKRMDDETVLEVGCGTGNNLAFLVETGLKVTGIDYSKHAVAIAKQFLNNKGLVADIIQESILTHCQMNKGKYDIILDRASSCYGTIEDAYTNWDAMIDALSDGGLIISYKYSTKHPDYLDPKYPVDNFYKRTKSEFSMNSTFHNQGDIHFANKTDISYFSKRLNNVIIYKHKLQPMTVILDKGYSEYIIIGRKTK